MKSFIVLFFIIIGILFLSFFVLLYSFVASPYEIKGNAMAPNYLDGQFYLVNKFSYRFFAPRRGDVIILEAPARQNINYIKRIIGLPGENIKIQNGKVYVNDTILDEPYLPQDIYTAGGSFIQEGVPVGVPENNYFVLGDNRSNSSDSRAWGFVPKNNIVGHLLFKYY